MSLIDLADQERRRRAEEGLADNRAESTFRLPPALHEKVRGIDQQDRHLVIEDNVLEDFKVWLQDKHFVFADESDFLESEVVINLFLADRRS